MKHNFLILLCLTLFACSCSRSKNEQQTDKTTDTLDPADEKVEEVMIDSLPWRVEYDESGQHLHLKKTSQKLDEFSIKDLVVLANKKYPNVELKVQAQKNDTLVVAIEDAFYLTQSMGSAGAESYLAELTYSLTEVPGVKVVKFNFEEGDHAIPGSYTRKSFNDFN